MLAMLFILGAVAVNFATWHAPNVRSLGVVLAGGCIVSNLVANGDQGTRAGVYSMVEILVMASAFTSYTFTPGATGRKLIRAIACVSLLSVCANIAYLGVLPASKAQQHLYDIATNLTFAIECILAGVTGVCVGMGNDRIGDSAGLWRHRAGPANVASERGEP